MQEKRRRKYQAFNKTNSFILLRYAHSLLHYATSLLHFFWLYIIYHYIYSPLISHLFFSVNLYFFSSQILYLVSLWTFLLSFSFSLGVFSCTYYASTHLNILCNFLFLIYCVLVLRCTGEGYDPMILVNASEYKDHFFYSQHHFALRSSIRSASTSHKQNSQGSRCLEGWCISLSFDRRVRSDLNLSELTRWPLSAQRYTLLAIVRTIRKYFFTFFSWRLRHTVCL